MSEHVSQPAGSLMCGICCVAMLTGADLQTVCTLLGHVRSTRTQELIAVFTALGFSTDKRLRVHCGEAWQDNCLVKAVPLDVPTRNWHWVCRVHGVWHDPALLSAGELSSNLRPVSYLTITLDLKTVF